MNNQIKSITVVGGGTAGWMCASYLNKHGFDVTLIESPKIPVIGVGESCMPGLAIFCDELGLKEEDWMRDSNARHKRCIYHYNWLKKDTVWKHWFCYDRNDCAGEVYMDAELLPPVANGNYSYHIDAILFGQMLKDKIAIPRGVKHIVSHINQVTQNSDGSLSGLMLDDNRIVSSDFYVDCSGQAKLLGNKVGLNFTPYKYSLNNRAIANSEKLAPDSHPEYTITRAASTGWLWDINLNTRRGCGYVHSSELISEEDAIKEYITYHPNTDQSKLRVINFKSEYASNPLEKNVLAVGLASGFIEPLEANSIYLIQYYIETFVKFIKSDRPHHDPRVFNRTVTRLLNELHDFVLTHYTLTQRDDSEYWRYFKDLETKINTKEMVTERANQPDFGHWSITKIFYPYNWWSKAKYFKLDGVK